MLQSFSLQLAATLFLPSFIWPYQAVLHVFFFLLFQVIVYTIIYTIILQQHSHIFFSVFLLK